MKYLVLVLSIIVILFTSCSKEDEITSVPAKHSNSNARLNPKLSNEEMENDILSFIAKLEQPEGQQDMNYKEAFEYVEATLNYKYVNYDYSKCANTTTFTSSFEISPDKNGMMSMTAISLAYDSILADWRQKYNSVNEDVKTPIVFDISQISATRVFYTMIVGYGSLDLKYWARPVQPTSPVYFIQAANDYTFGMMAQINNGQISRQPVGTRTYYVSLGGQYITDPRNYPSGNADISLPGNNGYTDFLFFFSSADPNYQNFHLYLSVPPQLDEYGFYATQLGQYVTNYATNNGGNRVSYCQIWADWQVSATNNQIITEARHKLNFYYGREYYTQTSLSTL